MGPWIPDELDGLAASRAFYLDLKLVTEYDEVERLAFGAGALVPV
jgi:hypothetical protein